MKNLWLIVLLTFGVSLNAQVDEGDYVEKKIVRITKNDGATYVGYLELMDDEKVIIETEKLGRVSIPKHMIEDIEYLESNSSIKDLISYSKDLSNQDPRNSRYLISGSAVPIKKGTFLANFNLWGPQFTYAATDNVTVGLATSWLTVPIVVNGKYSYSFSDKAHFAVGANFGFPSLVNYSASVINPYATLTVGSSSDNLSVSYHYFSGLGDIYGGYGNAFVIGGRKTINKKYAFLFDSFILGSPTESEGGVLLAPGFRYTYSPRSAFQFGLTGLVIYSSGGYDALPIPIPFFSWNLIL